MIQHLTPVKVFVINLDRDQDRLGRVQTMMDGLKIPFERWRATAGAELDSVKFGKEPIEEGIFVRDFTEKSKNEAACGISHIKLWRHIVKEIIPWSIVMEDDAILRSKVPLKIEAWSTPEDADIILLNARARLGPARKKSKFFSYGDVAGGAGTEGYMVSWAGADKLLKVFYPFKDPVDFQMYAHFESVRNLDEPPYYWKLPRNIEAENVVLRAYRIVPSLVLHPFNDSSIGNNRHPRAKYYCKVLLDLDFGDDEAGPHSSDDTSVSRKRIIPRGQS